MSIASKGVQRCITVISAIALAFAALGIRPLRTSSVEADEAYLNQLTREIAILVNEARVENGLSPLYSVPLFYEWSAIRAQECAQFWSHKRPDGSSYSTVIDRDAVDAYGSAEDIAAGSSTAAMTFEQWRNSPKHWAAILGSSYTHIGVGVAYDASTPYRWYWEILLINCEGDVEGQYIPTRNEIVPKACGDLTGDGVVNSYDYITLTDYLSAKDRSVVPLLNELQMEAADCFKDGQVNVNDAKALQRYLLGEYRNLPFVF